MNRRWSLGAGVGLLALLLVWLFWRSEGPGPQAESRPVKPHRAVVARSSWTAGSIAALPEARGTLSIQGRVVGPEGPVPGALVAALAPASPDWLSRLPPADDHLWGGGGFCDQRPGTMTLLELAAQRRDREAAPSARATTDAQGNFRIEGLEQDTFTLWAESGEDVGIRWDVAAGREDVEVRVALGQSFSGVVHDEQGGAVAGVHVTVLLRDLGRFVETATDAEGQFLLGPLPWGSSTVFLSKEGFLPARLRWTGETYAPDWREVRLRAPWRISGHVLDERGPVQGATVQLEGVARVPPVTTDARGHFELEGGCPGFYVVTASHEGRLGEQPVHAGWGMDRESVEILLGVSLRLSGRVTDPVGRPIQGAEVSVSRGEPMRNRTVRTDSRGRFLLEPLAPGTYGMSVQASRYVRRELPPRPLEASEQMHVMLKEARLVAGRTVDERGAPVEGVSLGLVHAQAGAPEPVATARSGADGAFVLDALEPGPWRVLASHPDFPKAEIQGFAPSHDALLVMRSGASLEVELVDGLGRPVSRVTLLAQRSGVSRTLTTDAGGRAVFRGLEPGRYGVRAIPPAGWSGSSRVEEVEVRGVEAPKVRLWLEEGWSLSGQVVDSEGQPLEGVLVAGAREGGSGFARAKSGPDGGFTLAHLAEGSWMLSASSDGQAFDSKASSGVDEVFECCRVRVSARSTGVRLVMRTLRRREVRGRVVREDGRPVTSFLVNGRQVDHPEGRFRMPLTRSRVDFSEPGTFTYVSREVEERAGESVELGEVVLKESRRVSGRVLEAGTSMPVAGAWVQVMPGLEGRVGAPTGLDGSFSVRIGAERWRIAVSHPDYPRVEEALEEGQREVTVVLEPGARLEGRIALADVPVASGTVQLRSEQGEVLATTGFWAGRYSFRALPAGRYLVQVVARPDEGPVPMFPLRQVELSSGNRVTLDFTEQAAGASVEVFVPERNIEVHLLPGALPLMGPKDGLYSKLVSGFMGKAVREGVRLLPRVPAGHYTLFAMRRDEDVTAVHREELDVPAEGQVTFSLLPQWSLYDD